MNLTLTFATCALFPVYYTNCVMHAIIRGYNCSHLESNHFCLMILLNVKIPLVLFDYLYHKHFDLLISAPQHIFYHVRNFIGAPASTRCTHAFYASGQRGLHSSL